ncbi:NADPH-dependent 2,4-dienoyl-CoA reductase/sulfur reductase-like enzyme [Microbacterium terrae]|uniref:Rhodocoxin reductase n=1 Tax=Microbacterium terrae TaxID=69369 RepID=A0A0M2HI91_9MICO|nr:FAD-dependent oxidoreductase [Microbacterium terrae]KJL44024.1 Rhodocoxin reductase [Microbacterium terrae]MBP1079442.1 NADPH-dependent 2,4-dienoyl-CoA reductase/sulfur reductase-like enzyme [Microbacterium terrae]GLJ98843.1 pyridine nucleotide-disulfide oxidoreductase [Microbacterium terrae]
MNHIVVVGAAAAGLAAAEELRRQGFTGALTVIGDEPHAPYDRPPLSKQLLKDAGYDARLSLRSDDDLGGLGGKFLLSRRAERLRLEDRELDLDRGETIAFDGMVIATGLRPRPVAAASTQHVLRTIDDARALRAALRPDARVVVIGAGLLGTEIASSAALLGCRVTLLDHGPAPLTTVLGPRIGAYITGLHRAQGVRILSNSTVLSADAGEVSLSSGEIVEADVVVACIGSEPATEWLADSGLTLGDGVVCDATCVAAQNVTAAGDVARWFNPAYGVSMRIEHRTNATLQGAHAARTLLAELEGRRGEPFFSVPYSWSDQFGVKIQTHGYLRGYDEAEIVSGSVSEGSFVTAYRSLGRILGVVGINTPPRELRVWQREVAESATRYAAAQFA